MRLLVVSNSQSDNDEDEKMIKDQAISLLLLSVEDESIASIISLCDPKLIWETL